MTTAQESQPPLPPSSDPGGFPPPPPQEFPPPPPPSVDKPDFPPPPPSARRNAPPPPPPSATNGKASSSPAPPSLNKKKSEPTSKKQPLSIEDILRKKKEADEAAAKPKFLSRKERERLALEKRHQEVQEQRNKADGLVKAPEPQHSAPPRVRNGINGNANGDSAAPSIPTGPRALRRDGIPTGPRSQAQANGTRQDMPPPPPPDSNSRSNTVKRPSEEEATAALFRERYMGADNSTSNFSARNKRRRTTEKKFNFEWSADEDTSGDYNPLYLSRAEANFYGRGRLGGFAEESTDRGARKYADAIVARDREAGQARAQEIIEMERRRKEGGGRQMLDKHWSEKLLQDMKPKDWRIMKEEFEIQIRGGNGTAVPNPMRSWNESNLPSTVLELVSKAGYSTPTPIQRAAIPLALQNRDIIGVAQTGSGKTAAFILPLLVYIMELPPLNEGTKNDGPYAVILAPTRELAQQIEVEAKKFATPLGFTCVSIVGGHSIEEQVFNLRDGAEIIIATPGRLVDCLSRHLLVLSQCCYVVMDEADRMIDLGFEEPVNTILSAMPATNAKPDSDAAESAVAMSARLGVTQRYRQTMMYTATMPPLVEHIRDSYLRRPATVEIGNRGEAVETVEQRVEWLPGEDRRKKRLGELLANRIQFPPPCIVFVNIKRMCDTVAKDVRHMGFSAASLHGSKTQDQREAALNSIRNGETDILVATDLAGRGIDVPDVSLVVNFNMAGNIQAYTHRIGRTGRAGKSGVAVTFIGDEDKDVLWDLRQILQRSRISSVPDVLKKHEAAQQKPQRALKAASAAAAAGQPSAG